MSKRDDAARPTVEPARPRLPAPGGQPVSRAAHCPRVGGQVRRWRTERGLTLARLSERSGLNVGYLSQIENDKAVPSLEALAALAAAIDVPIGWFLIDDSQPPRVVRAADRPTRGTPWGGRIERVDGGQARDISIVQVFAVPNTRTGGHAHAGDEHHIIVSGQWRMEQNGQEVVAGPGDYVVWDAEVPHDVELLGDQPGSMIVVSVHPTGWATDAVAAADAGEPAGPAES